MDKKQKGQMTIIDQDELFLIDGGDSTGNKNIYDKIIQEIINFWKS